MKCKSELDSGGNIPDTFILKFSNASAKRGTSDSRDCGTGKDFATFATGVAC